MYFYYIVFVILYCPIKDVFLHRNFQLGPRKNVCCSTKTCPLHRGFPYEDFV